MSTSPLVSIITPTFNSEAVIADCVQSVLNQRFKNWEHIIIDGKSTDGTLNLIKNYAHLKWLSEPDNGIYDAMNKGVVKAKGYWLYFLGSDDQLLEGALDNLVADNLLIPENDVVYGNVLLKQSLLEYNGPYNLKRLLRSNICQQAIFYARSIFEKEGLYNLEYLTAADYHLNLKIFTSCSYKIVYTPRCIALYNELGVSQQLDKRFEKSKVDLVANHLGIDWRNELFKDYLDQDSINQLYFGSIFKGISRSIYAHSFNLISLKRIVVFLFLRVRAIFLGK